jgi:hypothetical protein
VKKSWGNAHSRAHQARVCLCEQVIARIEMHSAFFLRGLDEGELYQPTMVRCSRVWLPWRS